MELNSICATCGTSFQRNHPQFKVWVCPSCYTTHSQDSNDSVSSLPIPEDMTLLTLDSVLEIEDSRYVFKGRYHYQLVNSYKNNWLLTNEKGEIAYLIESKGYYAFCKHSEKGLTEGSLRELKLGNDPMIENKDLYVDEVDKNVQTYYAGELLEIGEHATSFFSADLSNNMKDYAFIQVFDKKRSSVYLGKWGEFSDFKLLNTKETDGWK